MVGEEKRERKITAFKAGNRMWEGLHAAKLSYILTLPPSDFLFFFFFFGKLVKSDTHYYPLSNRALSDDVC